MKQFDPENAGGVTFEKFIEYMVNKTKDTDSKEELLASFKELANDKVSELNKNTEIQEFVTEEDLRKVMSNDRVDYLIKSMPKYEAVANGYDYRKWIEQAYGH